MDAEKKSKPISRRGGARPNSGGARPGAGRKPGVPNKMSKTVKENIIAVFENAGGLRFMETWALKNPNEFFRLYGRLLPLEITGAEGGPLVSKVEVSFVNSK